MVWLGRGCLITLISESWASPDPLPLANKSWKGEGCTISVILLGTPVYSCTSLHSQSCGNAVHKILKIQDQHQFRFTSVTYSVCSCWCGLEWSLARALSWQEVCVNLDNHLSMMSRKTYQTMGWKTFVRFSHRSSLHLCRPVLPVNLMVIPPAAVQSVTWRRSRWSWVANPLSSSLATATLTKLWGWWEPANTQTLRLLWSGNVRLI